MFCVPDEVEAEVGPIRQVTISEMGLDSLVQVSRFPDVVEFRRVVKSVDTVGGSNELRDERIVPLEQRLRNQLQLFDDEYVRAEHGGG